MTNEFEELDVSEDAPEQTVSDIPEGVEQEDLIASGDGGTEYNFENAPDTIKAPPRIDLNGKEVTIKKMTLKLPAGNRPWIKARTGDAEYKFCTLTLFYDLENQQEFISGVRVFKRMEGDKEKYSNPSIMTDRKNQASKLLGIYADYKKKDIKEVSLKEFGSFLQSQPKAIIQTETVTNPVTEEEITKNLIGQFIA